jgi:hypothetical protein
MLAEALRVGTDFLVEEGSTKLGMLPDYAPETDCLLAGVELFRSKHSQRLSGNFGLSTLTRLGSDLWRERLELVEEEDPEEEQEERDSKETWEWTPERIAAWLENLAIRGSHLVRRARWLCLLSESVITWDTMSTGGNRKKTLVFSKGRQHARDPDLSPDFTKTLRERQESFDGATYDRLVVVTTELKRLLSEDRQVEIRLRDNVVLTRENLARGLRWV